MEDFRTVQKEARAGFVERKSRFIGSAKSVAGEEEASDFIHSVRVKNREASHNVFAYLLHEKKTARCSDDGEPQGTGGIPVLNVIQRADVTDTVVVVTRYFGGILLGSGGLIRAYSRAASLALAAAGTVWMRDCFSAFLRCGYSEYGAIRALIAKHGGVVEKVSYGAEVEISFHIPCRAANAFQAELLERTSGSCRVEIKKRCFYKFP